MSQRKQRIVKKLGAKIVGTLPEVGGGGFGAARLAAPRERLRPQVGLRPGRPAERAWSIRRKIPMSPATFKKLQRLAADTSDAKRKVSPMQLAAQLLERSLLE